MIMTTTRRTSLAARPRSRIVGVVGFAAARCRGLAGRDSASGTPVPFTLQPLLVVLAGHVLGPVAGAASMVLYLVAGAAGCRCSRRSARPASRASSDRRAAICSRIRRPRASRARSRGAFASLARTLLAGVAGIAVIYLGGVAQLALLTGSLDARGRARRHAVRRARSREGVRRRGDQSSARASRRAA